MKHGDLITILRVGVEVLKSRGGIYGERIQSTGHSKNAAIAARKQL